MRRFEYIRLSFDYGDLEELNKLGQVGWRIISVNKNQIVSLEHWALMEREVIVPLEEYYAKTKDR